MPTTAAAGVHRAPRFSPERGAMPRARMAGFMADFWPKAWIASVLLLTLVMLRLGELMGPVRYIKPVFTVSAIIALLHFMNSKTGAWASVRQNRQVQLTILYGLCVIASVPLSIWKGQSFGITKVLPWAIGLVVMVALTVPTQANLDRVTRWVSWMAAVAGVLIVVQGAVVEGSRVTTGGSYDSNDLGGMFAMVFPFALGAAVRERGVNRLISVGAAFLILATLMRTGSRGGFLALLAGSLVFLIAFRPGKSFMALAVVAVLAPFGWKFAPPVMRERAATLLSLEEDYNTTSNSGRVYLWKRGIYFTITHPVVGIGAGTFEEQVGRDFQEQGTRGAWHTAHNTYIQIFAELGVIGGCILVILLGRAARNAARFWRWTAPVHRPELLAGVAAYLTAITFLSHGYSYLLFGFIAISALTEQVLRARGVVGRPMAGSTAARPSGQLRQLRPHRLAPAVARR